jgi:hypothetical protein
MMRKGEVFWGGLLILAGLLFLAGNVWGFSAWQFIWPLFLIAIGAWVLWSTLRGPGDVETEYLSFPLEEESEARIHIQYGAGRLSIDGDAAPGLLMEGDFAGGVRHSRRQVGERTELRLRASEEFWTWVPWSSSPRDWRLHLANEIPLRLKVEAGANEAKLDLRQLRVVALDIDTGASSTDVWLPESAGQTRVDIDSGAASVVLRVPDNVAARIETEVALSSVNVDQQRFPRSGKIYESPGYASAENRVEIHAEGGVGSLTVR